MPMPKRAATRKVTRAIVFAATVWIFADPLASMAEQPGNQQSGSRAPAGGTIDGATAAAIAAEGELKATIRTFQSDNPSRGVPLLLVARQLLCPLSVGQLSVGCVGLLPAL